MSEAGTTAVVDTTVATAAAAEAAKTAATKTNGDATKATTTKAVDTTTAVDTADTTIAATWPDDWRERLAGDDAKELARLKRFASPENYLTRTKGIENQLRAGLLKPVLSSDAGEPEVAEYRKAHGIPAEATMEGYGLKFSEGYQPSETDKADATAFLTEMHKGSVPAATVQQVWTTYLGLQEKAEQQLHDAAQKLTVDQKAEVRAEMGRDYDRNMKLGNGFLATHLGEEKAKVLTALPLANGTLLGDSPDFVRLFVAAALANADDAALVTAESAPGAGTIDEQYQAALAVADTDPKKYHSKEHQDKLLRLVNARMKTKAAA